MTWLIFLIAAILALFYLVLRKTARRGADQSLSGETPAKPTEIAHSIEGGSEPPHPGNQVASTHAGQGVGAPSPLSPPVLKEPGNISEESGHASDAPLVGIQEAREAFKAPEPSEIVEGRTKASSELAGMDPGSVDQQFGEGYEEAAIRIAVDAAQSDKAPGAAESCVPIEDLQDSTILAGEGDHSEGTQSGEIVDDKETLAIPDIGAAREKDTCEVLEKSAARRKPEPVDRGGAPRGSHDNLGTGITLRPPEGFRPKLELVCWKRTREWVVGIELLGEFGDEATIQLFQDGTPLSRGESEENRFCISQLTGEVVAELGGKQIARRGIGLEENDYLLFKLSGPEKDFGRLVGSPSSGWYLAIVREAWQRDEALAGLPLVSPEQVSVPGYLAHFFNRPDDGAGEIAFKTPDGRSVIIEAKRPHLTLVGNQLDDATEGVGPLFGGEPPKVNAAGENFWKQVGVIVVGEEGSGQHKWRTQFPPRQGANPQDLPAELSSRAGGWYFLRIYDENDDLMESMDFRLIRALKEIRIHQPPALPSVGRHRPVRVEFLHEPGCTVRPVSTGQVRVNSTPDGTSVTTVPPDPAFDLTQWQIRPRGWHTTVAVLVQRIWWSLCDEKDPPLNWVDEVLSLSRKDFLPTSNRALWVRLPTLGWVSQTLAGFRNRNRRPYRVKVAEQTVAIPLRDFADTTDLENVNLELSFEVGFERGDTRNSATVARIPADSARSLKLVRRALCKGGIVVYGDCRNCRRIAKECKAA